MSGKDELVVGVEFVEANGALWDFPAQRQNSNGEGNEED